jgi:CRP/FNR family transcriptional regulator, cyclic AMP receptor protein
MKNALYYLAEFEDDDVAWMSENGSRETVQPGERLIGQGEALDSLFVVLDGQFAVSINGTEVSQVGAGQFLGEISFVDHHPSSATVTATQESHVLAILREAVQYKLESDSAFAARFYLAVSMFLAERFRKTLRDAVPGQSDDEELDLDRLDRISRAGERFERILRQLSSV